MVSIGGASVMWAILSDVLLKSLSFR